MEISQSLKGLPAGMPYQLPLGYFNDLSDKVLEYVQTGLPFEKINGYTIPENYFEEFPTTLMSTIRQQEVSDELEEVAPFLNQISKKVPYTIPEVAIIDIQAIVNDTVSVNETPVIQMPVRKNLKWMQYAAAAVVVGVLITVGILYTNNSIESIQQNGTTYAQMDIPAEMSKLSEDELSTYLSATEKLVVTAGERDQILIDELPDIDEHIQLMTDDELKQYLNESTESSGEVVDTKTES